MLLDAAKAESESLAKEIAHLTDRKEVVDALIAAYDSYGMALPEAAAEQLSISGKPQTAREIWAAISAHGVVSGSKDPAHGIQWALRRRAEKVGDVVLVGYGKWGLREWFTDEKLKEIEGSIGGMAGRDRDVHIQKTKQGIDNLKARGVKWGRPLGVTLEQMTNYYNARQQGDTVKRAAEIAGFSPATVVNYRKRFGQNFDNWKPGDRWPPKEE